MTTWRELILEEMKENNESFGSIAATTLTDKELDQAFDDGLGSGKGEPFTVWTYNYVYFPVVYDGAQSVGFVSRNPNGKPTEHIGGH